MKSARTTFAFLQPEGGSSMTRALTAIPFFVFLPGLTLAQSSAVTPAFTAADVHASAPSTIPFMDSGFLPNGRYQVRNATLVDLIKTAWNIDGESVSGGPP